MAPVWYNEIINQNMYEMHKNKMLCRAQLDTTAVVNPEEFGQIWTQHSSLILFRVKRLTQNKIRIQIKTVH